MLHPQPVHLARELFAELLEELLIQELLFERFQNPRFYLVTPDREPVVASAFLTSAEAREPIAASHDEPSTAHTAFRQPREQILRPFCETDVAGACDRSSRCALAVLRGVPEFVAHYPEGRNLLGDPFCLRIQPRDAFAAIRILDVAQSVPDQAPDVKLVVQDSSAAFRVPVNRARTPRSSERSGDPIVIESAGDRFRCDSCHVLPEDPFNNRRFRWVDLSLTGRHGPAAQRLHYAVAVTEPARRFAAFDAAAQSSMRFVREILQEQGVHRSLESDVQMRDVTFRERDDVDACEGETLEESRGVFLVAAEAVQRFGKHDVEAPVQRVPHQRLESRAQQRGARDRVIGEFLDDRPALASSEFAADAELVRDRSVALVVGGVPRVDRNLHCTVTSGRFGRRAASSRARSSRAACRTSANKDSQRLVATNARRTSSCSTSRPTIALLSRSDHNAWLPVRGASLDLKR